MVQTIHQEALGPLPEGFSPKAFTPDIAPSSPSATQGEPAKLCNAWVSALLAEAVISRPVDEVAHLLALLRTDQGEAVVPALEAVASGRRVEDLVELVVALRSTQPSFADELVRAAVINRPVTEVARLLALVAVPGSKDAQMALRTAALGRPVADVARLAQVLRMPDNASLPVADEPDRTATGAGPEPLAASMHGDGGSSRAARGPARSRPDGRVGTAMGWCVACALLLVGVLHLPAARYGWSQWPVSNGLFVALACLCICYAVLVLRRGDTKVVWAGCAATAALMLAVDIAARNNRLALGPSTKHWLATSSLAALTAEALVLLLAGTSLTHVFRRVRATDAGAPHPSDWVG